MMTFHPRLLQDLPAWLDAEQVEELLRTPELRTGRSSGSSVNPSADRFVSDLAAPAKIVCVTSSRFPGSLAASFASNSKGFRLRC